VLDRIGTEKRAAIDLAVLGLVYRLTEGKEIETE
jgi:hypothetical protein